MSKLGRRAVFRMGRSVNNVPHDTHAAPSGPAAKLEPNMKIWIVFGDRVKFGHGRAQWLQTIDELGSLRKMVCSPERAMLGRYAFLCLDAVE